MLFKSSKTVSTLCVLISGALAGCAPSQHTFCSPKQNQPCQLPEPPYRSSEQHPVVAASYNPELKPGTPKQSVPMDKANKDLKTSQLNIQPRRNIEIIEVIRLSKQKPAPQAKKPRTPNTFVATPGVVYTIQIGAYKKEISRQTVISQFAADAPLYTFPMENSFLGLSFGSFETIHQAKAQAELLIKKGYTDLHIRKAPQSLQMP